MDINSLLNLQIFKIIHRLEHKNIIGYNTIITQGNTTHILKGSYMIRGELPNDRCILCGNPNQEKLKTTYNRKICKDKKAHLPEFMKIIEGLQTILKMDQRTILENLPFKDNEGEQKEKYWIKDKKYWFKDFKTILSDLINDGIYSRGSEGQFSKPMSIYKSNSEYIFLNVKLGSEVYQMEKVRNAESFEAIQKYDKTQVFLYNGSEYTLRDYLLERLNGKNTAYIHLGRPGAKIN